jgi:hypothetical protein
MKKELDSNNLHTTINNVCSECWIKASKKTFEKKWIKTDEFCFSVSTYHKWICDFCKQEKSITETRDFYYPNFNLI